MKLLTISIAGYNVEKFIRQTLDSLICKHIDQLEVLVVDDGGNDQTLEIVQSYAERYPGSIIPVHKENGGWGSTVNYSIQHATGKYFKLLDGDDFFETVNLDLLLERLNDVDADVVYTPYVTFDDETGQDIETFDVSASCALFKPMDISQMTYTFGLEMHALMFKTSVLQHNGVSVTEKCFYTDNEYRMKGMAFSSTIVFTNLLLYRYRIGRQGQSVDVTGMRKHYPDTVKVAKSMIEFHKSHSENRSAFTDFCVTNAIDFVYKTFIILCLKRECQTFDDYLKGEGTVYYQGQKSHVELLRSLHFKGFLFVSFMLRLRYTLAPKIKKIINGR